MRFIHSSDWHIGRALYQIPLLEDQGFFIDSFIELITSEGVDTAVICGDIYNRPVPSNESVALFDRALSRLVLEHHIRVLLIAGNHDSATRLSFGSGILRENGLFIAGTPTRRIQSVTLGYPDGPVTFWLLPHFNLPTARSLFPERELNTINDAFLAFIEEVNPLVNRNERNVLLAHGFFLPLPDSSPDSAIFSESELPVGALDAADISVAAGMFDYIALGHLHAPQSVGSPHVRYSGSPLKYSISEAGQKKAVSIVEISSSGEVKVEERSLTTLRDLKVLTGGFEELMQNGGYSEDYVYANITGEGAILYAMDRLRKNYPNILGLKFIPHGKAPRENIVYEIENRPVESLFGDFYESVTGSCLSSERMALVSEILRGEAELQ